MGAGAYRLLALLELLALDRAPPEDPGGRDDAGGGSARADAAYNGADGDDLPVRVRGCRGGRRARVNRRRHDLWRKHLVNRRRVRHRDVRHRGVVGVVIKRQEAGTLLKLYSMGL